MKRHESCGREHTSVHSKENAVFSGQTGMMSPIKFQNQSIECVGDCSGGANL